MPRNGEESKRLMRIKEITFEHGNDFSAILVCEHCGIEQFITSGYHDNYYHTTIIPSFHCLKCGKNRDGSLAIKDHDPN